MKLLNLFLFLSIFLSTIVHANGLDNIKNGYIEELKGNYLQAISEYEKALEYNPNMAELYISIGNIYNNKLNDEEKARQIYLKGLKAIPSDFALNLNIMHLYFARNDYENGIKHYEILSTIRKDNS
jgi:tetratricopeptide (TPR) repeat protein